MQTHKAKIINYGQLSLLMQTLMSDTDTQELTMNSILPKWRLSKLNSHNSPFITVNYSKRSNQLAKTNDTN